MEARMDGKAINWKHAFFGKDREERRQIFWMYVGFAAFGIAYAIDNGWFL